MPNYLNGKIYTIRYRNDNSFIYVGSTCQELYKRWGKHKNNLKLNLKTIFYEKIRETNDIQNWYIELYENYPCNSKQELCKREGEIQREIATLNMCIAGRTNKEWQEEHKNDNLERAKKWYNENLEKKKEYDKKRREDKYLEIKEKKKEYNKNLPTVKCECGCEIKINCLKNHIKTKKHINLLMTINA